MITGTISRGQARRLFEVNENDYEMGSRGLFYSNDRNPRVPSRIAPNIMAVLGLDNLSRPVRARGLDQIVIPANIPTASLFLNGNQSQAGMITIGFVSQ